MTPAPISVERLRELLSAATELPWRCTDGPVGYQHRVSSDGADGETVCDVERTSADAALIVAAVNALPTLLQQLAEYEMAATSEADEVDRRGETITKMGREIADLKMRLMAAERAMEGFAHVAPLLLELATSHECDTLTHAEVSDLRNLAAFLAASGGAAAKGECNRNCDCVGSCKAGRA